MVTDVCQQIMDELRENGETTLLAESAEYIEFAEKYVRDQMGKVPKKKGVEACVVIFM